ncbi:MAG: rhodanese-like domain-containing protein [Pseudomonadota bacterium]
MPLTRSAADLVAEARARIREIPAADALGMVDDDSFQIVDLRDPRELAREGRIPGALHCPRGMIEFWVDPGSPYFKPVFGEDKTFVFHCASGWRSALTVATLADMGFQNAAHISDGFKGWVAAGGPVEMPG